MLVTNTIAVAFTLFQACQAFPSPAQMPTTTDGTCGSTAEGPLTCKGSAFGTCCSKDNSCGNSLDHCGAGCQSIFGICDAPAVLQPQHHHQRHHARAFGLARRALDDASASKQITLPDGDADLIAAFASTDNSALSGAQVPVKSYSTGRAYVEPRGAGLLSGVVDNVMSTVDPSGNNAAHSGTAGSASAPGAASDGTPPSVTAETPSSQSAQGGPLDGLLDGLIPGNPLGGVLAETAGAQRVTPSSAATRVMSSVAQNTAAAIPAKQDDLVGGLLGNLPIVGGLLGGGSDSKPSATKQAASASTNQAALSTASQLPSYTQQQIHTVTVTTTGVYPPITAVPMYATGSIIYQPISLFTRPTLTPLSLSVTAPPPTLMAYPARPSSAMPRYGAVSPVSASPYSIR